MPRLQVDDDEVVVRLNGWEKLGAIRFRSLRFPRSAVLDVRRVDDPFREIRGLRLPGTAVPRLIALGTWRTKGKRDFVAIYRRCPGVVLDLDPDGAVFERVILGTKDSADVAAQLAS